MRGSKAGSLVLIALLSLVGCSDPAECTEEDARYLSPALCMTRHEIPTGLIDFAGIVRERGGVVVRGVMVDDPEPDVPFVHRSTERMGFVVAESFEVAPVVIDDPLSEAFEVDARLWVRGPVDRFFVADDEGTPRCDAPDTWEPAGLDIGACPYDRAHHLLPRVSELYVFFLDAAAGGSYELAWGAHVFEISRVSGEGTLDGASVYLEELDR